jgi:NTE family protein
MRALVLSGGGARGAYQVGVLQKVMLDEKRDYDILCGVSVGALNTAYLAQAPKGEAPAAFERLRKLWMGIDDSKIFEKWKLWPLSIPFKPSVYSTRPLRALLAANLSTADIRASGRKLRIGAVSWETGAYREATEQDPDLASWVLASSAFPIMFEHVTIGGEEWTDGGLRDVTPLGAAIKLGATSIDVVMCSNPDSPSPWPAKGKKVYERLGRMLDIVFDEIMRTDLQVAGYRNELAEFKPGVHKKIDIRVMEPKARMTEFDSLNFSPVQRDKLIAIGYKEAYEENF